MNNKTLVVAALASLAIAAAPALFTTPTESKWTVTSAGKPVATITQLTDGKSIRAEWKPTASGATVVFLGGNNKLWVRTTGGDVELASYKGRLETSVVPALMLPITTAAADKVDSKSGKVASYSYTAGGSAKATYTHDKTGPTQVDLTVGGKKYTLTRSTVGKPAVNDASIYAIRPRKGAVTQISRLAGDLFGPSDTKVSATAGARGVGRGPAFADGGNYDALVALETQQQDRAAKMTQALTEFQREGKVGKSQEE